MNAMNGWTQEEVELYCNLIFYADLIIYLLVIRWMRIRGPRRKVTSGPPGGHNISWSGAG